MDCKIYQNNYPAQPPKKRRSENNGDDIEDRDFNSLSNLTDSYPQRINNTETSHLREKLESEDVPIDFSVKNDKEILSFKRRKSVSPCRVVDIDYKSGLSNVSQPKSDQERQEQSWKNFDSEIGKRENLIANSKTATHGVEFRNNNGDEIFERRRSLIHVPQPNKGMVSNRNEHLQRTNGFVKSMMPEFESYLKSSGNLRDPTSNFNDILRSGSSGSSLAALSANDNFNSRPFQNYPPSFSFPGLYSPPTPAALTNGHQPFSFGTPDLSIDRKLSKASRPFKIFENEILSYDPQFPYNSVSTFMHNRLIESSPQHSPVSSHPANNGSNHSPTHQEPSTSSGSNGTRAASNSPNGFSDDSQQSNSNQLIQQQQQQPDSCQSMRRRGQRIPEDKKDAAYLEKRRKNNEAAKRSRDARRRKEDQMALRAKHLMDRNKLLEFQVASMEKVNKILELEVDRLKKVSCHQNTIIDSLQNELEKMRRSFIMNSSRNGERGKDMAPESPGL